MNDISWTSIYFYYFLLASIYTMVYIKYIRKVSSAQAHQLSYVILLVCTLMPRVIHVLFSISLQGNIVLTGSDQAYDHALSRYIQESSFRIDRIRGEATVPRIAEYTYYPALHFTGVTLSIVAGSELCPLITIPIIEPLILFISLRKLFKLKTTAVLSLSLLLTNGYFSIFHANYVRETFSFLLFSSLLLAMMKTVSRIRAKADLIPIFIIILSISFSHYYARYVYLIILWFFSSPLRLFQQRIDPSSIRWILLIMFMSFLTHDFFVTLGYVLTLRPRNYVEEILNVYRKLFELDISNPLVGAPSRVGVGLPEHDRVGIFLNQLVPLGLFIVYLYLTLEILRSNPPLKKILVSLALIFLYYGLLLLKVAQESYVISIGLRASQYVSLLYLILIMSNVEDLIRQNHVRKGINYAYLTLTVMVFLSMITYPCMLPSPVKGLDHSYYVPYMVAKEVGALLPLRALRICATTEAPGMSINDLFNGFVYGLFSERTDFAVLIAYKVFGGENFDNLNCDIVFFAETPWIQWGRIFDVGLFTIYAD